MASAVVARRRHDVVLRHVAPEHLKHLLHLVELRRGSLCRGNGLRCGNRLRCRNTLRFGVLLLELCITPHNHRNSRHSVPLYTLVQLAVLQRDTTASIRNVSDAIAAERRLRLVGSSAHLENAREQLHVIVCRVANAATCGEHLVNGEGLGDVNLFA